MITNNDKIRFLQKIADYVAISDSMYDKVEKRYTSITSYFKEHSLTAYDLELYVQGSFGLGTAIKPIIAEGEYDVDIICVLKGSNADILSMPQQELKQKVGEAVKSYCTSVGVKENPEDNRKCWTIHYSDSEHFHMDVVPALADYSLFLRILEENDIDPQQIPIIEKAILITDNEKHNSYSIVCENWDVSTPLAYIEWFDQQNSKDYYLIEKTALKREVEVAQLKPNQKRTDLQRAIQFIKWHRDNVYGSDRDKPVSIILTTIAARNYRINMDMLEFLELIAEKLLEAVHDGGVINPVNPLENFADKWNTVPRKMEIFRSWAASLKQDIERISSAVSIDEIEEILSPSMGKVIIKEATDSFKLNKNVTPLSPPIGSWGVL